MNKEPEEENSGKSEEKIFEEIRNEMFPNLMTFNLNILEAQQNLNRITSKRPLLLTYFLVNLMKLKDEEEKLKVSREK